MRQGSGLGGSSLTDSPFVGLIGWKVGDEDFAAGFAAATLLLMLGVLGYLRLGLADVRADVPPSWAVTHLFSAGVHASIRRTTPDYKTRCQ